MNDRTFDRITRGLAGTTSRRGALKLLGGGIAAGALGAVGVSQVATAQTTPVSVPISGTIAGVSQFVGNFGIQRFANQGGQLVAIGTLTGTLTNLVTGATQAVNQAITLPVTASGTCAILHLTLGPLDLNLLGLMVHLDRVVLNIDAQAGPGNLLGNLLCAVANLLNGGGPLGAIAGLLNRILSILG
jgi:hypothetical protein